MVNGDAGHSRTQAQRSEATRAALLAAARRLFAERGYAATPREEIVEQAGVTRGALQHHYRDKRALFQAVYEQVEQEVVDAVAAAAMRAGPDPVEQLRVGCQAYLTAVLDPAVQRVCAIDGPAVLPADLREQITDRYALGLVREVLEQAMAAGLIATAPVDPFARVLLAGVTAAADFVATADNPRRARREAAQTLDLILDRLQHSPAPRSP